MPKSLSQKLFEKAPSGPLPRKFEPKVVIRVLDPRTKAFLEFSEGVPIEGYSEEAFDEAVRKLRAVYEKMGILPRSTTAAENTHGKEKSEKEGPGTSAESEAGQAAG